MVLIVSALSDAQARLAHLADGCLAKPILPFEGVSLPRGYVQLPKQVLYARNLSRNAKLLYTVLLGYAWQDQHCFPGYQRLCAEEDTMSQRQGTQHQIRGSFWPQTRSAFFVCPHPGRISPWRAVIQASASGGEPSMHMGRAAREPSSKMATAPKKAGS